MNRKFSIELCGDVDLEGMVVMICYEEQIIAEINYERGIENLEIEMVDPAESHSQRSFPLDGFFKALEEAKKLAIRCAKEDKKNK